MDLQHLFLRPLLLVLLAAMGTVQAQAQQGMPPDPGVQRITAEEIAQAGLSRLSDLFLLIDAWNVTSVQGYTWDVSAAGLGSYGENAWIVLVDGQPVDLELLDEQNLNLLPLPLSEVAYVEVVSVPRLVEGVFAQAGVLHLHTRSPERGPSLLGRFSAGSEVGDPGPYRYTPFATPNIDRSGPVYNAAAAFAGGGGHARAFFVSDEHHATDALLYDRVQLLYQSAKRPRLIQLAGGGDLALTGRAGTHRVYGGTSRLQDLRFFEPMGLEVPTDHRLTHAGLAGDFAPGRRTGIQYRLGYTVSDLGPRDSRTSIDFDWREDRLQGQYEARFGWGGLTGAFGATGDYVKAYSGLFTGDRNVSVLRTYGQLGLGSGRAAEPLLGGYVSRVEGELGYGALAALTLRPAPFMTLLLSGTAAQQPFQEKQGLWFWVARGYRFPAAQGLDLTLPSSFTPSTTYTADVAWVLRPSERVALTFAGAARRFDKITLASYAFEYDTATTALVPATTVSSPVYGRVVRGSVALAFSVTDRLHGRLQYAYQRAPSQEDVFRRAWQSQPWHRFDAHARFVPNPRMSLYARAALRSETQWPDYAAAAAASGGLYEAVLPARWLLDLAVQKRFWGPHLRASFALRNYLNEPVRHHPAGAAVNLSFHAQVQAAF